MEKAKCRSCGAAIIWINSATTGSLMPLDAKPVENGNIAIVDEKAHVFNGSMFEDMLPTGPRYQSHFVSCPDATRHRKKK